MQPKIKRLTLTEKQVRVRENNASYRRFRVLARKYNLIVVPYDSLYVVACYLWKIEGFKMRFFPKPVNQLEQARKDWEIRQKLKQWNKREWEKRQRGLRNKAIELQNEVEYYQDQLNEVLSEIV